MKRCHICDRVFESEDPVWPMPGYMDNKTYICESCAYIAEDLLHSMRSGDLSRLDKIKAQIIEKMVMNKPTNH